jgi:hypothetical protein
MHNKTGPDLSTYKFFGKISLLQLMAILGGAGLLVTMAYHFFA